MKPKLRDVPAAPNLATLFQLSGSEAFGFDADTLILGMASAKGVKAMMWPTVGTVSLYNTTEDDITVEIYVGIGKVQVPLAPSNLKLRGGFYAIISQQDIKIFTSDGRDASLVTELMQIYTGEWDDPNGHVVPDNPSAGATYYKDQDGAEIGTDYSEWGWSVANKDWFKKVGN